jgi:hypothetical protein
MHTCIVRESPSPEGDRDNRGWGRGGRVRGPGGGVGGIRSRRPTTGGGRRASVKNTQDQGPILCLPVQDMPRHRKEMNVPLLPRVFSAFKHSKTFEFLGLSTPLPPPPPLPHPLDTRDPRPPSFFPT